MRISNAGEFSKDQIRAVVEDQAMSKSRKMKELFKLGLEVKEIAQILGTRYNFVYNVISNMVRMEELVVEKSDKLGKKDQIIELFLQGKTNTEISTEAKTNYQYVYKVIKDFKRDNPDWEQQLVDSKEVKEDASGE